MASGQGAVKNSFLLLQLDGFLVIGYGATGLSIDKLDGAKVVPGLAILAIQFDGALKIGPRQFNVLHFKFGEAEFVEQVGHISAAV